MYASYMKTGLFNPTTHILRLERGDDIHDVVHDFCLAQGISNATITGIGSVENPQLAHFSIDTKHFTERQFEGIYEITSLLGNVALMGEKPYSHLHITISDQQMQTFGGHFVKGACSATLEIVLTAYESKLAKVHDVEVGLNVFDL